MVEPRWSRRRKVITALETGKDEVFPSISKAKRESRKLQMDNSKALGRGDMVLS